MKPQPFLIIAVSLIALAPMQAGAQTVCAELGNNVIYGIGGSAYTSLIGQIASRLREPEDASAQLTIVYAQPGSCFALSAFDTSKTEDERRISATPTGTSALYWDQGSSSAKSCTLDDEVLADFSVIGHDESFCPEIGELPEELGDFKGPVATFNVIVPEASSERSISAEAIYFLLKFGAAAEVAPWLDERHIFHNGPSSGALRSIARAVGFSGDFEHGHVPTGAAGTTQIVASQGVYSGVDPANEPDADATIGFVSGENAENARGQVRTLAYQHFDQTCAYWPDSSESTFDKLNVRTGRYALWGSVHIRALLGEDDAIANPHVAKLIGYVTDPASSPDDLPLLDIYIDNYNVPQCAMQVSRDEDLGALASYQPEEPCGCYFEARATGSSSCDACADDEDCPSDSPVCRIGYCEVQ